MSERYTVCQQSNGPIQHQHAFLDEERHRLTLEANRLRGEVERLSTAVEDYSRVIDTQRVLIERMKAKLREHRLSRVEVGGEG